MEKAMIQWTIVNWITIVLMAALGAVFIGVVVSGLQSYGYLQGNDG